MSTEPFCKNCRLYNPNKGECGVIILYEGERHNLPVYPDDHCFFENKFIAKRPLFNKESGELKGYKTEIFKTSIQEVKFWVEDEDGQKTKGDGNVKIEYPEGFFGDEH